MPSFQVLPSPTHTTQPWSLTWYALPSPHCDWTEARHVAAGLVELAAPDAAVLVDRHAVLHVLAGGDQEEAAGALARAAALEVFGNEQLGDVAAGAVPRAAHVPAEVTLG